MSDAPEIASAVAPPARNTAGEERFDKLVKFIGFEEVVEAWRHPDPKGKPRLVMLNVMKKIGLADFAEALEHPTQKRKKILSSIFNRAADFAAGKLIVTILKLLFFPFILGMLAGLPTFMSLGLAALATGAFFGVYSYGRDLLLDYCKLGKKTEVFCTKRLTTSAGAFVISFFTGLGGAWLINTPYAQHLMATGKEALFEGAGKLAAAFNVSATSPLLSLPVSAPTPVLPPVNPLH